jgi:phospholipase D1/2
VGAVRCHLLFAQDVEFEPSVMNGAPYQCGRYAGSLRKYLFREHLGQLQTNVPLDVSDPVSSQFYRDVWQHTATHNTKIYEEVRVSTQCSLFNN